MVSARSNLELTSLNVTTGTTFQTEDELKNCECVSSAGVCVCMRVCVHACMRVCCVCVCEHLTNVFNRAR